MEKTATSTSLEENQPAKRRYAALHYRDFLLLWIGQGISTAGSQMQIVALNWHIYTLTHSPIALGIIGLSRVLPIIVFSLLAGSIVDAMNRKVVLFITETVLAVFSLILAFLTFTHAITPTLIYILTALAAAAMSFDMPARQALIPQLVKREDLANAMSLNSVNFRISFITGSAIAGLIIAGANVASVYLFNAVSFVAVIIALFLMHAKGDVKGEAASPLSLTSIKQGISFVKSNTMIWSTMLLDFFSTFFASATVLLPIYATDILRVGAIGYGILYASESLGSVIAGFFIAHFGILKKQGVVLLTSVGLYALATILFGVSKIFILSFIALLLVGFGDGMSTIIRNTIRQLATPDNIRGRMTSINMVFFMGGPQLGEFEAGFVASIIGAPLSVVTGGIATLAITAGVAVFVPVLRRFQGHEIIE